MREPHIIKTEVDHRANGRNLAIVSQWLWLRAHNQQPEHERHLSEQSEKSDFVSRIGMFRKQKASHAHTHIGKAVDEQPNAQNAGNNTRPVNQQPERKEPKTPKGLGDVSSQVVQMDAQHGQHIPLRLVKNGQKICAANQFECANLEQLTHERLGNLDQNQYHHERSVLLIYFLEQTVENQNQKYENHRREKTDHKINSE